MEDSLIHRLQVRRDRLTTRLDAILTECTTGVPENIIKRYTTELKDLAEKLEVESQFYLTTSKSVNKDVVKECMDVQIRCEDSIVTFEHHITTTTTFSSSTKLPKLELPKFDGTQIRWYEFWDKFEASIDRKDLPDSEKFAYLCSCLVGEAAKVIEGLTVTNENYSVALTKLQKRYGIKSHIIDAHYKALSALPSAKPQATECRRHLDVIETHLRVLQTLGENIEGSHLRVIIMEKFPDQVMYQVNLQVGKEPTVSEIREVLELVISAMEKSSLAGTEQQLDDKAVSSATTETLQVKVETRKPKNKPTNFSVRRGTKRPSNDNNTRHSQPPKRERRPCLFCDLVNHQSADCRRVKTVKARQDILKKTGRCLKCLSKQHTNNCSRKISCFRCSKDHLMMFCPENAKEGEKFCNDPNLCNTICNLAKFTYLQTAVGRIGNPKTPLKQLKGRLLLDSGSQRSYITKKMANDLELISDKDDLLLIYTFGATSPKEVSSPLVEIIIETKRGVNRKIQVNIVDRITEKIQVANFVNKSIDIPADDESAGKDIQILVGNDYYSSFMREEKIEMSPNLFLINTDFGWILSGNTDIKEETSALTVTTYCQCHVPSCPYFAELDLPLRSIDVNFLWSLESIGITDNPKATRQEEAVKHFMETVQYKNGRYYVKWPWIQYPPELSSNFGLAIGRLKSMLTKIDEETLHEYDSILKDQLKSGIIEEIDPKLDQRSDQPIHYLPHHMVKQKGKKGRLVYDASEKTSGQKSLNECLYSGPSFLEDLTALLLKFRMKKIGVMADVEKAFLQVGLQDEDRDVTRFLWIKDLNKEPNDDNLMYLRFCRVPFGIICSPMLLTATIRHHMAQSTKGDLLKNIADKCYVDNLVTSADTVHEARQIYEQTRDTFVQLGMNIRDWISNDEELMSTIPKAHQADQQGLVKVLGLSWNVNNDTLELKVSEDYFEQDPLTSTKRTVLRDMARIYDPLGFVCPLVLPMKILFQDICKLKLKWDVELPDNLKQVLKENLDILRRVKNVELPRYLGSGSPDTRYQVHAFTDASKNAYSCAVYIRGKVGHQMTVSFMMGKSRISRIEDKDDLKIPRLELLGFLIGSRMLTYLKNNIDYEIEKQYLWTDSLVVLGWMHSNKLLPPFVTNRVNEIKKNHPDTAMCYINTKSNPADVATRPELWEEKKELWFNGPDFLKEPETQWPENRHYIIHQSLLSLGEVPDGENLKEKDAPPEKNTEELIIHAEGKDLDGSMEIDNPESEQKSECLFNNETVTDIKKVQAKHFPEELAGKKTHLSRNLDLFLDVDGVLRCRGRMTNTMWSYDMKYPVLLPRDCEFTKKIISETHGKNYHVGASHTLSLIRERYWIPQGKSQVQKVIRSCVQCTKHGGGPYKLPPTPALPPERVNYSDPFTFSGVDYLGPLLVNTPTGKEKRWVALFTCLAVRAIHLEIVKDLTADECLLALRRFAATRRAPKRIYSDNATCFKLTSEVMTKQYCVENKIEWRFIPQLAPWHGGFYERLVALVKNCLKRTLEKHLLNDSKLLTVMKEIEAVVNSRPITQTGTELEHILRPADFLSLKGCLMIEPASFELTPEGTTAKIDLIQSWKRGLKIIEEFKRMFIGQYLMGLRERSKHLPKQPRTKSHRNPQIGDIVQIWSDSKNREFWKTGKIIALMKGSDNECRVAKVKTKDSVLIRSIGHLYPLEADDNERLGYDEVGSEKSEAVNQNSEINRIILEEQEELQEIIEIPDVQDRTDTACEESQRDRSDFSDVPVQMDIDTDMTEISEKEDHEGVDTQQDTLAAEVEVVDPPAVDGALRSRRDAAIRASERIREWTRHLLTLLQ